LNDLGLIAPEMILLVGGLLVFCLDVAFTNERKSGISYMALSILTLAAALLAVLLQMGVEPQVAFFMMDVDAFSRFIKLTIFAGMKENSGPSS
jgi:NADH:ubiquinone oxidoreductase subunit 2 (subunit N)